MEFRAHSSCSSIVTNRNEALNGQLVYNIDKVESINKRLNEISCRETAPSSNHHPQKVDELFSELVNHLGQVNGDQGKTLIKCFKSFYDEFKRTTGRSTERNIQRRPPSIPSSGVKNNHYKLSRSDHAASRGSL